MHKVVVAALPFPSGDRSDSNTGASAEAVSFLKRAEDLAAEVISPLSPSRHFSSFERRLSYFSGRAALGLALKSANILARVAPDPFFGYLRATDLHNQSLPTVFVNISHTQSLAVAAVSLHPVGIDVERVNRNADFALQRVAAEGEKKFLGRNINALAGTVPAGIALWSAKEAFSKAIGLGLKFGLARFEIDLEGNVPFRARTAEVGPLTVAEPAITIQSFNGFLISVCTETSLLRAGLDFRVFSL
jgi:4'-phosphopantetheinyl transferase EntD